MTAHNGLRGLACLHVVFFHSFLFCYADQRIVFIHLNGYAANNFFFLLSGFTLGVVYGRNLVKGDDGKGKPFNFRDFY